MGPLIQSSPTSPAGSSHPCSSITTTAAQGKGMPTVSACARVWPMGIRVVGEVVSVAP